MNNTYPTPLARLLASQVGLHPISEKAIKATKPTKQQGKPKGKKDDQAESDADIATHDELVARLQHFQQMALNNEFDNCMTAYHGFKLSKPQEECLANVFIHTQAWLRSLGLDQMVQALQNSEVVRPSIYPAAELLDRVCGRLDEGGSGAATKALHVKVGA